MSQIEFVAQSGYAFIVALRNPYAGYASLATGLTVTSVTAGVYRASTGSLAGVVYVEADASGLRVVGYANLSAPGVNGYSEVFDTLAEAEAASLQSDLAELSSKIQTGIINVVSPVNADGELNPIVIGDDYLAANGRAFDFLIDPVPGIAVETTSCLFGGQSPHRGEWLTTGVVTAVTIDGVPKWRMRAELDADDTIECRGGCYAWSTTLLNALGKRITRITGDVALIDSQTIE